MHDGCFVLLRASPLFEIASALVRLDHVPRRRGRVAVPDQLSEPESRILVSEMK
jgi:hypothetical protein